MKLGMGRVSSQLLLESGPAGIGSCWDRVLLGSGPAGIGSCRDRVLPGSGPDRDGSCRTVPVGSFLSDRVTCKAFQLEAEPLPQVGSRGGAMVEWTLD